MATLERIDRYLVAAPGVWGTYGRGAIFMVVVLLTGCAPGRHTPDLGEIYSDLAGNEDPYRNPIIVIPGLLGSRLVDASSGEVVWGAFGLGQVDPDTPGGARLLALPMKEGVPLHQLRDRVEPSGALDRVVYNVLGVPVQLNAYYNILRTLGVGGYRDDALGEAGAVDYGNLHFTCFQFDYDWRRDLVETAAELDRFIREKAEYVRAETLKRHGIVLEQVKFDIVTHSMGGLVARYYLRYGAADLPVDGSIPEPDWAGAKHVDNLVMIAPPNGGSMDALTGLTQGVQPALLFPHYPPVLLNTMPSIFELLPRGRHQVLLNSAGEPVTDLFNPALWRENQWGLADPGQSEWLEILLPGIQSAGQRTRIALDHQKKLLDRARQFTAALDVPASPPPPLRLLLIAGDAEDTQATARLDSDGILHVSGVGPGDGTVLRSSALMDERLPQKTTERLDSPIAWNQVLFIFSDHLGLTQDTAFADNVLYFLLESPKNSRP